MFLPVDDFRFTVERWLVGEFPRDYISVLLTAIAIFDQEKIIPGNVPLSRGANLSNKAVDKSILPGLLHPGHISAIIPTWLKFIWVWLIDIDFPQ